MITKERLQQLVAEKATVYTLNHKIQFTEKSRIEDVELGGLFNNKILKDQVLGFECDIQYEQEKQSIFKSIPPLFIGCADLYETLEEVEFEKEFGNITRTEKLEIPSWEEFLEMEELCFWKKNHRQTVIRILGTKYIAVETNYERFFTGELTKENYIKACRKAKALFLGEEEE